MIKKEKSGALYNPNYLDPATSPDPFNKAAGVGTNYGMPEVRASSNDPYGFDSFADVQIGAQGRSNSQLARMAPGQGSALG